MKIEYDSDKNKQNFAKHGVSFEQVLELDWDNAIIEQDMRKEYGKVRMNAFCRNKNESIFNVIFTMRGSNVRIISFRRANAKERKIYEKTTENY